MSHWSRYNLCGDTDLGCHCALHIEVPMHYINIQLKYLLVLIIKLCMDQKLSFFRT